VPRARLLAVFALGAALLVPGARGAVTGDHRVLVVLATYGPRPYTVTDVQQTMKETQAFYERSSYGQLRLRPQVTAWLSAFPGRPRCADWTSRDTTRLDAFVAPAGAAASAAGYNVSSYDRIVYSIVGSDCNFRGIAWHRSAVLTEVPTAQLVTHELGHTFGLAHAAASRCAATCPVEESGDPFSPMGEGFSDFSTYEKRQLGWLPEPLRIAKAGTYRLAPAGLKSNLPRALVLPTSEGEYWFELRKGRGIMVRLVVPESAAPPFAAPAVLLTNPTSKRRPWVATGETFRARGLFTAKLAARGLRFTLLEQTNR
jgi:Metallo-peptidase family M12